MFGKRVLVTGDDLIYPEPMAAADRALQISKGFNANGCEVKILSSVKYDSWRPSNFCGINIIYGDLGPHILDFKPDIIFCLSSRLKFQEKILYFAKKVGSITICDVVEDPLGQFINNPIIFLPPAYWKRKISDLIDIWKIYSGFWKNFDIITVISDNLRVLVKKMGLNEHKIFKLPILKFIDGVESTNFKRYNRNIISYCGGLQFKRDKIQTLLKAVSYIKRFNPNIQLNIYGKSRKTDRLLLKWYIRYFGIKNNVSVRGYLEKEKLIEELSNSFALIVVKGKNRQNLYNFPNKLIDYLYSGRPILMPKIGEMKKVFKHKVNAVFYSVNNAKELAKAIQWVYENENAANEIGRNGRRLLEEEFDSAKLIKELLTKIEFLR